jgi:hypothetical protein
MNKQRNTWSSSVEFLPNTDEVWGSTTALKEKKISFLFQQHFIERRLRKE